MPVQYKWLARVRAWALGATRRKARFVTFPVLTFSTDANTLNAMHVSAPRFVKCFCQYCDGHIEFDAKNAGEIVACPHCGLETKLYVPQIPLPGPPLAEIPPSPSTVSQLPVEIKRRVKPFGIAALALGIVSGLVYILIHGSPVHVTFNKSPVYVTNYVAAAQPLRQVQGTSASPVYVTKYVTNYVVKDAAEDQTFRRAQGKLDDVKEIAGECTHVARSGVIVQQFRTEVNQVYAPIPYKRDIFGAPSGPKRMLTSETVAKIPTQKVFLRNYTDMQAVAVGQTILARARRVGTIDVKGERLECWDCAK
jgi:hypothetical protein